VRFEDIFGETKDCGCPPGVCLGGQNADAEIDAAREFEESLRVVGDIFAAVEAEVQAEAEERQFVERRRALIEDLSSTIGILAVVASDLSEIVVNSEF
jgi:hypothetical protein